jgi:hypothetical protein
MNEPTSRSLAAEALEAARGNPLGAAVVGAGVVWLAANAWPGYGASLPRDSIDAVRRRMRAAGDYVADVAQNAVSSVNESSARQPVDAARHALGDAIGEASEAGARTVRDVADNFGRLAERFGSNVSPLDGVRAARAMLEQLLERQPLLLAAGGFALGAAIAASLPATDMEARAFGDTADSLKTAASNAARAGAESAGAAASAAAEEARRQGLI